MAKKQTYKNSSLDELRGTVAKKRDELRALRFTVAGSKNRNVKLAQALRKDIARALTALNAKKE